VTDDEWLKSVRKRTHDLANVVQGHEGRLVRMDERQTQIVERVRKLEAVAVTVGELRQQARVLRWLLGAATAAAVGLLVRLS